MFENKTISFNFQRTYTRLVPDRNYLTAPLFQERLGQVAGIPREKVLSFPSPVPKNRFYAWHSGDLIS
jgi:hypothetical protein